MRPFYTANTGSWTNAADLRQGDQLVGADGSLTKVSALIDADQATTVYNLSVNDIHTYYAGEQRVLVHNCRVTGSVIDPRTVRFTRDTASFRMSSKGTVADLAEVLKRSPAEAANVPPVRLVRHDGNLFSLDNRRLIAFQDARVPMPFRMATNAEITKEWQAKFTTVTDGLSIQLGMWAPKQGR